jgi:hypothetical protein
MLLKHKYLEWLKELARLRSLTLSGFIENYSQVTRTPKLTGAIRLIPYFIFRGFRGMDLLLRFIRAGQYISQHITPNDNLPDIELLFVTTRKDSDVLPYSIKNAIRHSLNNVNKIAVIVPANDLQYFSELLGNLSLKVIIELISEDLEIDQESRDLIKSQMNSRYGWTLQQFLTVSYCLRTSAKGVLAVNSDTLILRDQVWIDQEKRQILMESHEFNSEYYSLIERTNSRFKSLSNSHITHHMLFQPDLLKETIFSFGAKNISEYVSIFMSEVNADLSSPLCVEFEPYANYLRLAAPSRFRMVRFCNIGVVRGSQESLEELIFNYEKENNFNSISMHSWMG